MTVRFVAGAESITVGEWRHAVELPAPGSLVMLPSPTAEDRIAWIVLDEQYIWLSSHEVVITVGED